MPVLVTQKLNLSKSLYMSQLPASLKKIRSKMKALSCQHFPHYKPMGAIGCLGVLSQSAPKPYATFPHPIMLHIKFYKDWQTGLRDSQV